MQKSKHVKQQKGIKPNDVNPNDVNPNDAKPKEMNQKYPLWDNYRYAFHHLKQKAGLGAFALSGGNAVMRILLPFLEASLAAVVTACLVSGRRPGEILLLVTGYVALMQTVRLLQRHLAELQDKTLMLFRFDMGTEQDRKALEMDGQSLESARGKQKYALAIKNNFSGSYVGIQAYVKAFWDVIIHMGGMMIYGAILGQRSLPLLLVLLAQTLLGILFQTLAGKRGEPMDKKMEMDWKKFHYLRRESIVPGNGKDIRMYRLDSWFLRVFRDIIGRICTWTDKKRAGFTLASILEMLLSFARNVLIYGFLIRELALGRMALPAFLLYVGIVAGFERWMVGLSEAMQQVIQNNKRMDEFRDFMDFGTVDEGTEALERPGGLHEIRFEQVCFRYEGSDEDTLHDLNLTIRAGEKLALVGLNGAGKTTLIKLLCGLYRPTSGRVYLDGQDMGTISQREVFKEFAVVFQDVFSFSFSFAENVSCKKAGREKEDRLRRSLEQSGLWEKVEELPKGVRTMMNQDLDREGVTLSGGELQKLMLARALYKDTPIVILDEPTAALDPIAESEMYEKYDGMIRGKTAVFISHRLSSTRFCDRILFLEKGRIIQEGSHAYLMEQGGAYAELFALQSKYYQRQKKEEECYV